MRILLLACSVLVVFGLSPAAPIAAAPADKPPGRLSGRVIAVGIPGAGAVSQVGTFLPGGPIQSSAFVGLTQPGQVLDPNRLLVASQSNFGAPLARADQAPGAILSLDPQGPDVLQVPSTFATADGQVAALGGRVQLFSAQSPAFLNARNDPDPTDVTKNFAGVSQPLGLSLNRGFGRVWPANAPYGLAGAGTSTVLDATGIPLAGPPDRQAGGVFAGSLTNRSPQLVSGSLSTGAVGTALLGPSPEGTGKAVFVVVTADGALVQVNVQKGVDGLAPAGTVGPLNHPGRGSADQPRRVGVLWDGMCLVVTDPVRNQLLVLMFTQDPKSDNAVFRLNSVQRVQVPADLLAGPVDLAPTQPNTTSTTLASNTTRLLDTDFYVANWANNTIVRMNDDGSVRGVRQVGPGDDKGVGDAGWHLNGLSVAPDATHLWATFERSSAAPHDSGLVMEFPMF